MSQDLSDDSQMDEAQEFNPENQQLPFLSINFVQQVDELVSLAHYGPSIVLILGVEGIGKTCTLEQLENETSDIGQIRIDGNPMLSIDQLHASFLQQLNNYEQAVEYNSVRDSLLRASEVTEQLIVVDDAQQLSTSVLESLISLVSPIEQSPAVPVRLFLFGNQELKQQLKMESFPTTAVYCLELKGFEKEEISSFLGHQLNLSDDDVDESFDSRAVSQMWKSSQGNPGAIIRSLVNDDIDLEDVKEITQSPIPSIIYRSLLGLLGVALLLLALFGEKWFGESWLQGEQGEPQVQEQTREAVAVELNTSDSNTQQAQQLDPEPQNDEAVTNVIQSTDQLPNIEKNVLDENPAKIDTSSTTTQPIQTDENIEAAETPLETTAEIKEVIEDSEPENSEQSKPQIQESNESTTAEPINDFTANENYLLEQPSDHYAIQLVGLSNLVEIQKFSQQLTSDQTRFIYRSLLNGNPWFILVMGDYPDAESARAAKDKFKPQLKNLRPWIKSYAKIQNEIRQAADTR